MELELDERTELEDIRELLLEVVGTITLDDELEIITDDWLDLEELATELDGVTDDK